METKGKGVLLCVLSCMLLFTGVVMPSSCGGSKSSQSDSTLEELNKLLRLTFKRCRRAMFRKQSAHAVGELLRKTCGIR